MDYQRILDLFTTIDLAGIIAAILLIVFKEELANYARSWIFHLFKSGEYNFDGLKSTADWCEDTNKGKGEHFLRKIVAYSKPFPFGKNCIASEVRDDIGEIHDQDVPTLDWLAGKKDRRKVSAEQAAAIKNAGNDWPKFVPKEPEKVIMMASQDYLDQAQRVGDQLKNAATSLNSVGSRVSSLNKTVRKAAK